VDADALQQRINAITWCHPLTLGGIETRPQWHVRRRFQRRLKFLQIPQDLTGKTVLDIGAWDGFFSFECERRGAARVVAADHFSWHGPGWGTKAGFTLAREALGSRVEDIDIDVMDLAPERIGTFDVVLFLDDDILPFPDLVAAHVDAHRQEHRLVAGRVLQPWDEDSANASWAARRFASSESRDIDEFMGGNFSVRRKDAIEAGGFDENFVRVAYNFEREFADRWRARGGMIQYVPIAAIHHLKAASGGTRSFGDHLRTVLPGHSVGNYYYLLRSQRAKGRTREFFARPLRAIATRHHLRRPWWIPITLVAELSGMAWALTLHARGPRYCSGRYRTEI